MWIQEKGAAKNSYKVAAIAGGFIDVKDTIIIYTDAVRTGKKSIWSVSTPRNLVLKNGCGISGARTGTPDEILRARTSIAKAELRADVAGGGRRSKNTGGAPRGASMTPCRATNKGAHYG